MSTSPIIERVHYDGIEATQEQYVPHWGAFDDPPPERTQWRLHPRIAEDAVKRISDRLRWKPVVLAEREVDGKVEKYYLSSLNMPGIAVATNAVNETPDHVAAMLADAVTRHRAAVEAADAELLDRITTFIRAYDQTLNDWRVEPEHKAKA